MRDIVDSFWQWVRYHVARGRDERGEGVISAAIAVLIMAFLGVGMWVAFNATFSTAQKNVDTKVNSCIGQSSQSSNC